MLQQFQNLHRYACDMWQIAGVGSSMFPRHYRDHYFRSHTGINRHGILPIGPHVDFNVPHGREEQFADEAVLEPPAKRVA